MLKKFYELLRKIGWNLAFSHGEHLPPRCLEMKRHLLCLIVSLLAAGPAGANPDTWVKAKDLYEFREDRLDALAIEWQFDDFFSNRTIWTYDTKGDGIFSKNERESLGINDPLSRQHVHLRVFQDDEPQSFTVERFEPRIDRGGLVFRFSTQIVPPLFYDSHTATISFHDSETVFDFSAAGETFLRVERSYSSACNFRAGSGTGPLKGLQKIIGLRCGEKM